MNWITFEITKEQAKSFINSLPNSYWHENKSRFFRKEHNCSLLVKTNNNEFKFIITSTHDDFTFFMVSHLENFNIEYKYVANVEDTKDYEFIISKEIDQLYIVALNQQVGGSRVNMIREKYLGSHLEKFESKLARVFSKIAKYEFEFSILIATSYLEELVSEAFRESFELNRYDNFENNVKTSLTFSFKIEFLFAKGLIDDKTLKALNHLRKIRNLLAHQSVLEQSHEQSINSHIQNIQAICDNGISFRPETIQGVTDSRLTVLIPVIENLCFAFIGTTHFINPFIKLGGVHYANKGYGTGFIYSTTSEFVTERVLHHLEYKYHSLKLKAKEYHKYGINVNF